VLLYGRDHSCSHHVEISAERLGRMTCGSPSYESKNDVINSGDLSLPLGAE
jgi:hypothetical protein